MAHPCADARYDPREPSLDWVLARAARADRVPATVDAGPKAGDVVRDADGRAVTLHSPAGIRPWWIAIDGEGREGFVNPEAAAKALGG